MDKPQPSRGLREGEEAQLPVPAEHDGSLHEAGRYHLRLHEEALPGPCRCPVSRLGAQQEDQAGKELLLDGVVFFFSFRHN